MDQDKCPASSSAFAPGYTSIEMCIRDRHSTSLDFILEVHDCQYRRIVVFSYILMYTFTNSFNKNHSKEGIPMNVFDILGPVMIGPSSSHTAGAARIGRITRTLLGAPAVKADILLHGSFAKTYKGHGTDKALSLIHI